MEKKGIDVEKSEEKGRERTEMVRFLGKLLVLYLNPFLLAQPLSPKVKYELICEKKWLVECMDEEWSESPWNEVGLKRDVGDAEWKCGFIDILMSV